MALDQTIDTPRSRRPRGWWIPYTFVLGFLVMLGANGTMVYMALSSWVGLETNEHYRKGLDYNRALEGARAQAERGWRASPAVVPLAGQVARVEFGLADRDGVPLTGATVRAMMVRPTYEGHDFSAPLAEVSPGRYAADLPMPRPGIWDLRIVAEHPKGNWQQPQSKRFVVKD